MRNTLSRGTQWGTLLMVSIALVSAAQAQTTVSWTGASDGISFQDPGNWNPTPDGLINDPNNPGVMIVDQGALVNNYVVDDAFAFVFIDPDLADGTGTASAGVTLDPNGVPASSLSFEFLQGTVDMLNEAFGGYAGDFDELTTETMLIDGAFVSGHFVSGGLAVQLNSGSLTLRGVGNPIASGATIDFDGSLAGQLFSFETPEDFITEHLSKVSVQGFSALQGANIDIASDGGSGTLVTVLSGPLRPGDFTGDGDVDAADWGVFRSNLFTSFSPATLRDGYLLGDLDTDSDNDENDFVIFKSLFEDANGIGSFAALTGVPEPGTLGLSMLAMLGVGMARRRRSGQTQPAACNLNSTPRSFKMRSLMLLMLCALVLAAAMPETSRAVIVAEDSFTSANGPVEGLSGGTGWSSPWGPVVGDTTPPTGLFEIQNNQAIYNGNNAGQIVNTQERTLSSPVLASTVDEITIDFDLIIGSGAGDVNLGRGIGLNFIDNGNIAFTLGKRLNGPIGIWDSGIGAASTQLGGTLIATGTQGTHSLSASLSYNGADSLLTLTDGLGLVNATFAGTQLGFDAVQLTGYHQSTTSNGIDDLTIDVSPLSGTRLTLEVDPDGNAALVNQTGSPIDLDLYKLSSPDGNLNTSFTGIEGNPQAGFPAGDGSGNGWEKAGGNSASVLGEAFLTGQSTLASDGTRIQLGDMFNTVDQGEALEFIYRDLAVGGFISGFIDFVPAGIPGDFNGDGSVDGLDFLFWQVDPNVGDLADWEANYGSPLVAATSAVPEPASAVLMLFAAMGLVARPRWACS